MLHIYVRQGPASMPSPGPFQLHQGKWCVSSGAHWQDSSLFAGHIGAASCDFSGRGSSACKLATKQPHAPSRWTQAIGSACQFIHLVRQNGTHADQNPGGARGAWWEIKFAKADGAKWWTSASILTGNVGLSSRHAGVSWFTFCSDGNVND